MLSGSCIYGLRAAIYVAAHTSNDSYVSIREISEKLGISFHFLTKILQRLTEGGVMKSHRGPGGGVTLARPAARISILEIVEILDGPDIFRSCILGLPGCGELQPCPLHKEWSQYRERLRSMFGRSTLSRLAGKVSEGRLRLADVPGK